MKSTLDQTAKPATLQKGGVNMTSKPIPDASKTGAGAVIKSGS